MTFSRRSLLAGALLSPLAGESMLAARAAAPPFKIGVTDWNLRLTAKLEAVETAARLGFEGVEISLGRDPVDGKLLLADPGIQEQYLAAAKRHGIALAGTCLDILHRNYLKSDPLGLKWIADGIPITKKLNAGVMLLPFFGQGALTNRQEIDYVGDLLKDVGKEAEKHGVFLGLENTISAEDNVRIMERSQSSAVSVYYDCGNATNSGFDPLKEMRWLGKDRICQMHLKDNPYYLGEGRINLPMVIKVMREIRFTKWANLETNSPSNSVEADMRRNLSYLRGLLARDQA